MRMVRMRDTLTQPGLWSIPDSIRSDIRSDRSIAPR